MSAEEYEMQTVSTGDGESAIIERGGDDFVHQLVQRASEIDKINQALDKVIHSRIKRQDWTCFGEGTKARFSLGSAGAERLLLIFPFKFTDAKSRKEEWEDDLGKAYRYVTEVDCELYGSKIRVSGTFSTRDKLLGYTNQDGWKDLSQINENDIEKASLRVANGNGIKTLLGLRHMPPEEIERIYAETGREKLPDNQVTYGKPQDTSQMSKRDELKTWLKEMSGGDHSMFNTLLKQFSVYTDKSSGNERFIDDLSKASDKWIAIVHAKVDKARKEQDAAMENMVGNDDQPFG